MFRTVSYSVLSYRGCTARRCALYCIAQYLILCYCIVVARRGDAEAGQRGRPNETTKLILYNNSSTTPLLHYSTTPLLYYTHGEEVPERVGGVLFGRQNETLQNPL